MTEKEKGKRHPSRIRQHWHNLQIHSLRICNTLYIVLMIYGVVLLSYMPSVPNGTQIYIYNTLSLCVILLLALVFFAIIHFTYRRRNRGWFLAGVTVFVVVWMLIPMQPFFWYKHADTQRLDGHVYHLMTDHTGPIFTDLTIGLNGRSVTRHIFRIYSCDPSGILCHVVFQETLRDDPEYPTAHLVVDPDAHTISLNVQGGIQYTYPESDS